MNTLKYRSGFKYIAFEDYTSDDTGIYPPEDIHSELVSLTKEGILTIKRLFGCDCASGPTIDTKSSILPSFEHDALCYLIRQGSLSVSWYHAANIRFKKMLIKCGMWRWRAHLWYLGVESKLAIKCALKKRLVLVAP